MDPTGRGLARAPAALVPDAARVLHVYILVRFCLCSITFFRTCFFSSSSCSSSDSTKAVLLTSISFCLLCRESSYRRTLLTLIQDCPGVVCNLQQSLELPSGLPIYWTGVDRVCKLVKAKFDQTQGY